VPCYELVILTDARPSSAAARRRNLGHAGFHRTVLDEFYRIAFRKKIYHTIDELRPISTARKTRCRDPVSRRDKRMPCSS
jgi:hypothetical protein